MSELKDLCFVDILGEERTMSEFLGKKVLIVNTASECGFTSQYEQLQEIYDKYGESLEIIGFPCNDFGAQEPHAESEIIKFCSVRYGVNFILSEKVRILGEEAHPIFQWLQKRELNGVGDFPVKWNFNKFLISSEGKLEKQLSSAASPLGEEFLNWLNGSE